MPTPNVDLLKRTLAHIKDHKQQWDQGVYHVVDSCGTAMCFAGWAITLAGGQWAPDPHWADSYVVAETEDDERDMFTPAHLGQAIIPAGRRAARILGLTDQQAKDLFHPENGLGYLETAVAELCAQAAQDGDR